MASDERVKKLVDQMYTEEKQKLHRALTEFNKTEFNKTQKVVDDSWAIRIQKVAADLWAIREELLNTLTDNQDGRFLRLSAEIKVLAHEFLPEELRSMPQHTGHDIELYDPNCPRCVRDDTDETAAVETMNQATDKMQESKMSLPE